MSFSTAFTCFIKKQNCIFPKYKRTVEHVFKTNFYVLNMWTWYFICFLSHHYILLAFTVKRCDTRQWRVHRCACSPLLIRDIGHFVNQYHVSWSIDLYCRMNCQYPSVYTHSCDLPWKQNRRLRWLRKNDGKSQRTHGNSRAKDSRISQNLLNLW